jgi:hypothetical protein
MQTIEAAILSLAQFFRIERLRKHVGATSSRSLLRVLRHIFVVYFILYIGTPFTILLTITNIKDTILNTLSYHEFVIFISLTKGSALEYIYTP